MKSKNLKQLRKLYPVHTHSILVREPNGLAVFKNHHSACRRLDVRADSVWEPSSQLYRLDW